MHLKNAIWKMVAILSQPQCINCVCIYSFQHYLFAICDWRMLTDAEKYINIDISSESF